MNYHYEDKSAVAPFIAERILEKLRQGKTVLWLLSGGSGGQLCIEASKLLKGNDLTGLYVTMSDERYGKPGHNNENFDQLVRGGLSLPGAALYRPLVDAPVEATTQAFNEWLEQTRNHVDYAIVTLGVGEDGHTSGVKPHSPGVSSNTAAAHFVGDDFTRVTTTLAFLRTFDETIVQAYGADKHHVIQQLIANNGTTEQLPMLAIHDIPQVTFFSDYKKEDI